jgi:hypothetical protein
MTDVREAPASKVRSSTIARVLQALELLVFEPANVIGVAEQMGMHERTARRMLYTLEDEGYLQRGRGVGLAHYAYYPTTQLLALAGQLCARMPFVARSANVVADLQQLTGHAAYVLIPSYGDALVVAAAGDHAPAPWTVRPATACAGGRLLLASGTPGRDHPTHAAHFQSDTEASLAVAIPMPTPRLAALALTCPVEELRPKPREQLLMLLTDGAARLRDVRHWHRHAPPGTLGHVTLRVTATDLVQGRIRMPNATKALFPDDKAPVVVRLRGVIVRGRWNPRHGRPPRGATLHVEGKTLRERVQPDDVLVVEPGPDGLLELT